MHKEMLNVPGYKEKQIKLTLRSPITLIRITVIIREGAEARVIELLPGKCEALSSNSSTTKKQNKAKNPEWLLSIT
jgi:hypothetical protein